jgi:MoaA/NifB/PqqE/SkfB family radical SAM enzyme
MSNYDKSQFDTDPLTPLNPQLLSQRKSNKWKDAEGYTMFQYERVKRLELEFNNTCFLYCGGCGRTFNPQLEKAGKKLIMLEDIKKFFPPEFVAQLHYFLSCGNYGDPTAHPETLDILRYFRDNGCKNVSISSNGASRSPEWWAELATIINGPGGSRDDIKNYYGGRVTFSIDGLADTNHLYRVGAKWDRIVENVTAFINAGGRARWQWIMMNHNEHQLEEAKAFAKDIGFSEFIEKVSFRYTPIRMSKREAEKLAEDAEFEMLKDRSLKQEEMRKDTTIKFELTDTSGVSSSRAAKQGGTELSPVNVSIKPEHRHPYREKIKGIHLKHTDTAKNFWNTKQNIICQNIGDPRIYVDATGKVWPCNWLGGIEFYENKSDHWPLPSYKKYGIDDQWNSLYNFADDENPVRSILEHPFYEYLLEEDWKHSAEMQPAKCKQMCHTELGDGIFEAMRRNEQNLKTGEYKDLSEIHDTGITQDGQLVDAPKDQKTGRYKHQGGTGIGPGSHKSVQGLDQSVLDIETLDDDES